MFGKVMKQELRANSLLYGVASAIALLFAFATVMNRTRGTDVSYLVKAPLLITGCTVAIVVLVMLFLIHTALRYQKSMYGNEGYLTFSLPVSSVELVTGKYAAAALWGIIVCVLCALLCFSILYGAVAPSGTELFWAEVGKVWAMDGIRSSMILISVSLILSMLETVAILYLAITLAHLPFIRKGNGIFALIFFFGISFAEGKVMELIPSLSTEYIEQTMTAILDKADLDLFFQGIRSFLLPAAISTVVMSVVYLAVTILLARKYTSIQ
nr:hypothetical protein [uncultured Anaerotignum sp.]